MKKQVKELTNRDFDANYMLITNGLSALNILLKVGNNNGLSIAEIGRKTGINPQVLYRYKAGYDSQKKHQPSMGKVLRVAEALGYELRVVKKEK